MSDDLLNEIKSQLYDSKELAEQISLGGLVGCCLLIILGILGCIIVTCQSKVHEEFPESLDDASSTGTSNSLSRSPSTISEETASTTSRSTVTSEHKSTMTDEKTHDHDPDKGNGIWNGLENPVFINEGEMTEKVTKI